MNASGINHCRVQAVFILSDRHSDRVNIWVTPVPHLMKNNGLNKGLGVVCFWKNPTGELPAAIRFPSEHPLGQKARPGTEWTHMGQGKGKDKGSMASSPHGSSITDALWGVGL